MCTDCNDKILNPQAVEIPFCLECAEQAEKCIHKFRAECVFYNFDNDHPSELNNLGIKNKTSVAQILETIDEFIGNKLEISLALVNSSTVGLTRPTGAKSLKADVKVSGQAGNQIQVKSDGLYIGTGSDFTGKIKIDATDIAGYLEDKLMGGTDGVSSISLMQNGSLYQIQPTLDIKALLQKIHDTPELKDLFCKIVGTC
jgi:hypothetical protein